MAEQRRSDVLHILDILRAQRRFVLLMGVLAGAGALLASLIGKHQYQAKTEFFLSSPYMSDRNNIYHTSATTPAFVAYFAPEEDIDKLIGMSKTEEASRRIVLRSGLAMEEKTDTSNPKALKKLMDQFQGGFLLERSEYGLLTLAYKYPDAEVAARVANTSAQVLGSMFGDYHRGLRNDVANGLQVKVQEADSAIATLTDSLGHLRDRYGIYEILSPNRQTIISSSVKGGGQGYGYALEQVQNIESIKDQLVVDRARYQSVLNEYREPTGDPGMLKIISPARAPIRPYGLGPVLSAVAGLVAGLALGALWVLLVGFYRLADRK